MIENEYATPAADEAGTGSAAGPSASGMTRREMRRAYRRERRESGDRAAPLVIGLLLVLVGGFFLLRQFIPALDINLLWPFAVIVAGVLLILAAFTRRETSP
jgi:uncharacterized membrane protein HdeD (DUF308 family)